MRRKKIKKIIFCSVILTLFMLFKVANSSQINAASNANIRYIIASVGENERTVGINYHCDISGSKIVYGTSATLGSNTKEVLSTSTEWENTGEEGNSSSVWAKRFVCTATLANLSENTQYYYQVVAGTEKSPIHSFKTYQKGGYDASILLTSDIHCESGNPNGRDANNAITNILAKNKKINVVISTGDMVDEGGIENTWKSFTNDLTSFNNVLQATVPGNHEYYYYSAGAYVSPLFYNKFYNNPKNGPDCYKNSSYYFKYGNALIILIDTIKRDNLKEQQTWFKNVIANNPSQWIIVGSHAGAISCGSYADDANWIKKSWVPVFEECQVDLCVSGHEHIYIRNDLKYNDEKNEQLGITYLVSAATGNKSYNAKYKKDYIVKDSFQTQTANVINIKAKELTVSLYNNKGELQEDYVLTLKPKRPYEPKLLNDKEILEGITLNYDKEANLGGITWNKDLYGNVKSLDIERNIDGIKSNFVVNISSTNLNQKDFSPIYSTMNYTFTITINKADGSTLTKEIKIINNYPSHNITYELNGGAFKTDVSTTFKEDTGFTLPIPEKDGYIFNGWYLDENFTTDKVTDITTDSELIKNDIKVYANFEKIPTKKGCKKSSLLIESLAALSLFYIIIKKKH